MLSLKHPIRLIEDIAIFSDSDPGEYKQFYFMPSGPRLSTKDGKAIFHALRYTGNEKNDLQGGFLTFEVDLGISDAAEAKIRTGLAASLGDKGVRPEEIRLAPVPVVSGKVSLMLYDSGATSGTFVRQVASSQTPSLYGDNRAIFSVSLSRYGMELVAKSLKQGEHPPIGVLYTLDYVGLLPAYHVKVTAHWDKVSDYLKTKTEENYVFYHKNVSEAVEKLQEKKAFVIDVDNMVGAEAPDATTGMRMMVNRLTDLVIDKFFTPVVTPETQRNAPTGGIFDSLAGVAGIFSAVKGLGYSFSEEKTSRKSDSDLNAEVTERVAVKRTLAPCAFLNTMRQQAKSFPQSAIDDIVFGDDPFFQHRTLLVRCAFGPDEFKSNEVASIDVEATYGNAKSFLQLTPKSLEPDKMSWARNKDSDKVDVKYTVRFADTKTIPGRKLILVKGKFPVEDQSLCLAPSDDLFRLTPVPVEVSWDFPWDRYPQLVVECRTVGSTGLDVITKRLTRANPRATEKDAYRHFTTNLTDPFGFEYRVLYAGARDKGGDNLTTPWMVSPYLSLEIKDPRPHTRQLTVDGEDVPWAGIRKITLDFTFEKGGGVNGTSTMDLTADKVLDKFRFFADVENKRINCKITVVGPKDRKTYYASSLTDQMPLTGPATGLDKQAERMLANRQAIRVALDGKWDPRFDSIQTVMQHNDAARQFHDTQATIYFSEASDEPKAFEYPYLENKEKGLYRYRIEYRKGNKVVAAVPGLTTFTNASDLELKIPAAPK